MGKHFTFKEKLKYVKLVEEKGFEYARIQFLIDYEHRYIEKYEQSRTAQKRRERNPARIAYLRIDKWHKLYNTHGEYGLMDKTGKHGKAGRKKKRSINDLNQHDRALYQEIMEEVLRDQGINPSIIIDKIKEKKEKKGKEFENVKAATEVLGVNRTSLYKVYIPKVKEIIDPLSKHLVPGLIEWLKDMIRKSDYTIGRDKLYKEYRNTINSNVSSYVFRIHFESLGYHSKAYIRKNNRPPTETKYRGTWTDDYVKNNFKSSYYGEVLHADVSYVKIQNQWWYLHVITETFSNSIVTWSLSKTRDATSTIKLTQDALSKLEIMPAIFHTDHGIEYANYQFKNFLKSNGIIQSMSPKGNSLANRPSEYLFSLIKREKLYLYKINDMSPLEVTFKINEYVEWYNTGRVQSNLNYKTPQAFLRSHGVCV